MKPEYRIELRIYDKETDETVAWDETSISVGDNGSSSFEMADICLGRLERHFPQTHARC